MATSTNIYKSPAVVPVIKFQTVDIHTGLELSFCVICMLHESHSQHEYHITPFTPCEMKGDNNNKILIIKAHSIPTCPPNSNYRNFPCITRTHV